MKLLPILILLLLTGCSTGPNWEDPGPRAVFEAYLLDLFKGDLENAFDKILPEDREELTRSLQGLNLPKERQSLPHEALVVAGAETPYDIRKLTAENLKEEPKAGHRTTVAIEYHDGRRGEVAMVWSGNRWFVDLPL